jgi:hypothetical protein
MMFFGIPDFAGKKHGDSGMQSGHAAKCRESEYNPKTKSYISNRANHEKDTLYL